MKSPIHSFVMGALLVLIAVGSSQHVQAQTLPEAKWQRIDIGKDGVIRGTGVAGYAPSPDGRWVVYSRLDSPTRASLWLAPAAGGEAIRLTDAGYFDIEPAWAPTGDRIFFSSNRAARGQTGVFIMSVSLDPTTGRATGFPRQITLDLGSNPKPSPDGSQILFRSYMGVRLVPANGGNSRIVAQSNTRVFAWEPDGTAIYYAFGNVARGNQALYRLPLAGGSPTRVLEVTRTVIQAVSPSARLVAVQTRGPGFRESTIEVLDFSGRVLTRNVGAHSLQPHSSFSADGRSLLAELGDVGAIMRVRPVRGGDARDLTDGVTYDWPVAWTADSRNLIAHSGSDRILSARILPVDGSPGRTIPLQVEERASWDWGTPTHVSYVVPRDGDRMRLITVNLTTGERTVLSDNRRVRTGGNGFGPGGLYRDIDGFYFVEDVNGRVEYKSSKPGGPVRTLHSIPADSLGTKSFGFQGNRMAFTQVAGDSVALMYAEPRTTAPRVLMTLGRHDPARPCCNNVVAFSYDGAWLAVGPVADRFSEAIIVRVPQRGRATEIRRVPVGANYWYEPRWLPDNSGFTVIAGTGAGAWVVFVPITPGDTARNLTRAEDAATWGNEVSPDGKWVAYPAEVWRGTTLWRMDLSGIPQRRD